MSSWADMSDDHQDDTQPVETNRDSGAPHQRRKLQLKPRSAKAHSTSAASSGSSKSNPFGAAKPREEVLASKGIDAKTVDERIQKKAAVVHFTREQNDELEVIRAELTKAEEDLRNANEQELPEEEYRVVADEKKKILNEMLAKFTKENAEKQASLEKKGHPKFERPSERRRRLDEEGGGHHHQRGEGDDDEAFSHFGGRHHGGKRGDDGHNY